MSPTEAGEFPLEVRDALTLATKYYRANLQVSQRWKRCGLSYFSLFYRYLKSYVVLHMSSTQIVLHLGDEAAQGRAYGNLGNTYHLLR